MSDVRDFENRRWSSGDQDPVWRHRIACELVRAEPVCDVGGGDGLLLKMLRDEGRSDLHMTDLSPVAVEKARAAGFDAVVGDLLQGLPFEDDAFGTVCALDVLEHLLAPLTSLREIARIGREIVVAVPNFSSAKSRLEMMAGRVPFQNRPQRGHSYWMNGPVLRRLFADAGLRVIEWRYEPSTRLGPLGASLARLRPDMFAVSFAARLEKV